ncbi:MAG: arginine--tRNA ligase [Chitinophagaceae bacterium]|nr:arginine--tRNA ligase [Chitinophagaceae bacterium]MCF8289220.1 arginine--tRNA ligase [Chitinophagaceae bacterium]MCF8421901.1 arginine--tRNA ligase [Chitinophagaceae bacterium]
MQLIQNLKQATADAIQSIYQVQIKSEQVLVNATKPEIEGDYTIVLFAFVKQLGKSPDELGNALGEAVMAKMPGTITAFNIVKGFLNFTISDQFWLDYIQATDTNKLVTPTADPKKIMVEYSSPNTNKPLHLGHLRNNFLGWSIAEILKLQGNDVVKTCIVNDRGIHICKSMIAWQLFASGATPESINMKGDHFVGDYYVKYNDAYKAEIETLIAGGMSKEIAEQEAPIQKAAQAMLLKWEQGDADTMALWKRMNEWVYAGFDVTYKKIGSDFFKTYYESNTYLLGKDLVDQGLTKKVFYQKEDSSVWIDLTSEGLDEKIVRRKDGTSVYITQDIGLAELKQKEFNTDASIYVVGDEQNYHFKVLKLICQKLQLPASDGIYHLSYGMVELPTGKMKSREGTVVDADDLVDGMIQIAKEKTESLGKVDDFTAAQLEKLYDTIGLGALKFFLLRVDPKKKMIFNPEESIDFHGFTGPFIQYTHARIKSILRKTGTTVKQVGTSLLPLEKALAMQLANFSAEVNEAAEALDPSKLAIYAFNLAKLFNSFYAELSIANAESEDKKNLRIQLGILTAATLKQAMQVLGIEVPEQM